MPLLDEAVLLVTIFGRGAEDLLSEIESFDPLEVVLTLATGQGNVIRHSYVLTLDF